MSDVAIRFEKVSKRYRLGSGQGSLREALTAWPRRLLGRDGGQAAGDQGFWALKDVSFELQRGEVLGIIGPNGAGKTTILKLLAGVTKPTAGQIEVKGQVGALIELGAGFHPDLTGRDNIYLYGTILGLSRREIDRKFNSIVQFAELERFIDTPVKRYSSGMFVRLGFSVAVYVEPDILLVDEVLSVGDLVFQRKCIDHMNRLVDKGMPIVFVSHQLRVVEGLCSRTIYLSRGQIVAEGNTGDVIKKYIVDSEAKAQAPAITTKYQSGDASLTKVEFFDLYGTPKTHFGSSEGMVVRTHYSARQRIQNPVFSVGIYRSDGLLCWVARTNYDGVFVDYIEGDGYFDVEIKQVQLHSGKYTFAAAIFDSRMGLPYASERSLGEFVVGSRWADNVVPVYCPLLTWRIND